MKKYIRIIPLIISPFTAQLFVLLFTLLVTIAEAVCPGNSANEEIACIITSVLRGTFKIYVWIIAVYNTVMMGKGGYTAKECAKMNLAVKAVSALLFLFCIILCMFGLISLFFAGIAVILTALSAGTSSLMLTGIHSIGCAVGLKKAGVINSVVAVFTAIASFIPLADLVVAILYFKLCTDFDKKKIDEQTANPVCV